MTTEPPTKETTAPNDLVSAPLSRLIGSRVRINPTVRAYMDETQIRGDGLGRGPFNSNSLFSALPDSLVLYANPPKDQEFIVVGSGSRLAHNLYRWCAREKRHEAVRVVVIHQALDGVSQTSDFKLEAWYRLVVPLDDVDVVQWSRPGDRMPVKGWDYADDYSTVHAYRFEQTDKRFDGYTNQPTAALAVTIKSCADLSKLVEGIRTKSGSVTVAGLEQLSRRQHWESRFIPDDARYFAGFPGFWLPVDYENIADELNSI